MDCSICLNSITKQTGKVELSCSHEYHMKCITQWFAGKEEQTCPCCRKASTEDEVLGRKSKEVVLPRHIHIQEWGRRIECDTCREHVEFLEHIRELYGNLLKEVEQLYRSHLGTAVIVTIVNIMVVWRLIY